MIKKVIHKYTNDNGEIAVLISQGYGAGWSTWNSDFAQFALFDEGLVRLALRDASYCEVAEYIKSKLGEECYFYTGGWHGKEMIKWLPPGTAFVVDEYDGLESLRCMDNTDWFVA